LNSSEKADASELQRMNAIEQQKAQFQAQVHNFTDVCWANCVDRFIDTTLSITNRFTQMVQKGSH
uniref:Mitochondrial import inner membrane translocase subunit n=1 Tax=Hucho hucho TaxID=62062 RepID=A0A4W5QCD3_9TELE